MHHVGKPRFYELLKEHVITFKKEGYIVYFEGSAYSPGLDSMTIDTFQRKLRKMKGLIIDSGYAKYLHEHSLFRSLVDQPRGANLGLDSNDINVDVHRNVMIEAYEKKYDPISLEKMDFQIPLDPRFGYPKAKKLPKNNVYSILIDYRNENLASKIQTSDHKEILVLYGFAHMKGIFSSLQKLDPRWRQE